jgi:hypothetical protein
MTGLHGSSGLTTVLFLCFLTNPEINFFGLPFDARTVVT